MYRHSDLGEGIQAYNESNRLMESTGEALRSALRLFCIFEYFIIADRNNNSKYMWPLCRSLRYNFQERDK